MCADIGCFIRNSLRTYAEEYFFAVMIAQLRNRITCRKLDGCIFKRDKHIIILNMDHCIDEVHRRHSNESGNECINRLLIKFRRGINLLNEAVFHNNDTCTHRHGFCLIMCNIYDCCLKSLVKLCDLNTHLYTKLGIKVGKRLIHKEYLRITDDCTSESNTLSLSA